MINRKFQNHIRWFQKGKQIILNLNLLRIPELVIVIFSLLFFSGIKLHSQEIDPHHIYKDVQASILKAVIYDEDSAYVGSGTAVVVSSEGIAYSVFHLLSHSSYIKLFSNEKEIEDVKILGIDPSKDILILKIPPINFKPTAICNSDSIKIGDVVYTLGNPRGYEKTFAEGLVSNVTTLDELKHIQFSASISPGSSGGALLNSKGELIGITAASDIKGQNLNFAIPVNEYLKTELIDLDDSMQCEIVLSVSHMYNRAYNYSEESILKLYNTFMNSGIKHYSIFRSVGDICYDGYLLDTAINLFNAAISYYPDDKYFYVKRATCYMLNGEYDSAEVDFQKAIELDSNYYEIYFYRSFFYNYYNRKFAEAVRDYTKLLELKPEYVFIYFYRANAYLNIGDTIKAIKDLDRSFYNWYATDYDYSELGLIYNNLKMYSEAIKCFSQAIEQNPRYKLYYYYRAFAYSSINRHELSVLDYLKYLELETKDPSAYNNIAWEYYHIGNYELAEKNFIKSLSLDPDMVDSYIGLSVIYLTMSKTLKCKRSIYQAIKLAPILERGYEGLELLIDDGYFWTDSEKKEILKVLVFVGLEDKDNIETKTGIPIYGRKAKTIKSN